MSIDMVMGPEVAGEALGEAAGTQIALDAVLGVMSNGL
jgi:hypothetical protein